MTADQVGRLAELLAAVALSRSVGHPYNRPLFRATHLGDKYPTVDLIIDLLGPNDVSLGFCFAQVKGTSLARPADTRLQIDVPLDRFNRLVRTTAPCYLVGVDIAAETAHVMAAHRLRRADLSSMTKASPLNDPRVRIGLYREILGFWTAHRPLRLQTGFGDV